MNRPQIHGTRLPAACDCIGRGRSIRQPLATVHSSVNNHYGPLVIPRYCLLINQTLYFKSHPRTRVLFVNFIPAVLAHSSTTYYGPFDNPTL